MSGIASSVRRLTQLDEVVPRLLRSSGLLVASTSTVGLLGIVTLALTARAIGPAGIGILALVEAYIRSVDLIFRWPPTQAVIKHAAGMMETDDRAAFVRLVKLSFLIDLAGGCLSGGIAIMLGYWASTWFDLGSDGYLYILLVAASLFFSFRPTGIAILRLFDRFDLLAISDACIALARLAIAAVALALDLGIWAFVTLLFLQSMADGLVLFVLALREMYRRGYPAIRPASARQALSENKNFFRFLFNANFSQILRQAVTRFDVLALGLFVGPSAVGFYQVAKRSGKAMQRFGRTLTQVLFPELARMWVRGERDRFGRLILLVTLMTLGAVSILFVPIALSVPVIVKTLFGADFLGAVPIVKLQLVAVVINIAGVSFVPALLSMGLDRQLMGITSLATIGFAAAFVPAVMLAGALGAMACHVVFSLLWFGGCLWLVVRHMRSGQGAV
ncbi:lipopolysaccharide biosynthesis protein [Palleronia abyssalis]|uniref:Inner membrane protein YghQ n=1 Tax=Palleronia abyssalis TaxID=1501240 RepID=A0A2R8BYG3_9RHOB|nr:oligosaccharide flippase family protein [Palleronia abyssalis]SPJ25215.1 Inner membrane protein YghQ [Palleronia abyssalis]